MSGAAYCKASVWNTSDGGPVMDDDGHALILDERVVVERPIYNQVEFDRTHPHEVMRRRTPRSWMVKKLNKVHCSGKCFGSFLLGIFPFIAIMKKYRIRRDLPADIVSGLTVGIMHIPQGMAYGHLTSLPPVYGLYVSFFPVLMYFLFGTSKHMSVGTFAVVCLMIGTVVDKGVTSLGIIIREELDTDNGTNVAENVTLEGYDRNDPYVISTQLGFAMAVTFAVGCLQLLMGFFRLGFVAVYLSDPLVSGFTTGAACHVFTSQIKHIFGVKIGRYYGPLKLIYSYRDFFTNIPSTNSVTLITSIVCIVIIVVIKEGINNNPKCKGRLKMPVPVELIVVVVGTIISHFVHLKEKYKVSVVGPISVGIPPPKMQQFTYLSDVISDAFAIGIVAFAISVSMAKILAKKHDYDIDPNQELFAYGISNVFCSFFSSFTSSASLSRSLVQEGVGGKTQVAGLVSSCLLLVVLLVIGPYFEALPNSVLAAIIIVALKGMFKQFTELKRLWRISIIDFAIWLVTFVATFMLDVDLGLLVGVIFALLTVIYQSQRPYACVMGQVPGTDLYRDVTVYTAAQQIQGIKIFRYDSALFFANSEHFKNAIYKLTVNPKILKKKIKKREKRLKMDKQMKVDERKVNGNNKNTDLQLTMDDAVVDDTVVDDLTSATEAVASDSMVSTINVDDGEIHSIIIDCSTISYVDSVGVKTLGQIVQEYNAVDIQIYLAQCRGRVRAMLEKTGYFKTTEDREGLFVTIHDAVLSLLQTRRLRSKGDEDHDKSDDNIELPLDSETQAEKSDENINGLGAPLADSTSL
ncbi:solute carrier family 26 member 6-like isoform X3 [Gigantopelta aegis]|uniref:solute carrier family 26 member 6-like isoform X3 n=1 Tax=Gigantopelta aegis TaxID=1735272 RepID=UPI001B88B4D4|nr:solute carrier family 26 member 6-like isoform X3 [Gigantopelta aegis]